jgi:hypothetical protein
MNRRIFKKHCKRAMIALISKHGYRPDDFHLADGDETLYAPSNMQKNGEAVRFFSPLRGTPLYWYRACYEDDEWDVKGASELLEELEFYSPVFISEKKLSTDKETTILAKIEFQP